MGQSFQKEVVAKLSSKSLYYRKLTSVEYTVENSLMG